MSSVLDELREGLLRGLHPSDAETFGDYIDDIFRDFEAEHPGLIELVCCDCGRPVAPGKLRAKFPEVVCIDCAKDTP